MVVDVMQGADQHIRRSLGFSILPKYMLTCRPGESNQQCSNNKTLALSPELQPPDAVAELALTSGELICKHVNKDDVIS